MTLLSAKMGGLVYFWSRRIFTRVQYYNSVVLVVSTVAVKLPISVSCTRLQVTTDHHHFTVNSLPSGKLGN